MKLYSFQYNDYGSSYHVMSDSKENALKAIVNYFNNKVLEAEKEKKKAIEEYGNCKHSDHVDCRKKEYEKWNKATLEKLPDEEFYKTSEHGEVYRTGYEIKEYDINEVIETERA